MAETLTIAPITLIILILITVVPAIVKFVGWIIGLYRKHNQNQRTAFEQGRQAEQDEWEEEERFEAGEARIGTLEEREDKLEQILLKQQTCIDTLVASDNLNIKYNIKRTWEKVCVNHQPIDAYDLDLLESRYAIYAARGGNSWAKKMMEEIRKVATTTSKAPLKDEHKVYIEDEEE